MMAICLAELSVHQAACVHYVGWATGFQYYLVVFPAFAFFLPACAAAAAAARDDRRRGVHGDFSTRGPSAPLVHPAPASVAAAVTYANSIAGVFALLGLFGWSFRHAADAAEAALAAAERAVAEDRLLLWKAAVDVAADVIVIADAEGSVELVNPAFTEVTGFTADEFRGRGVVELRAI